MVKALWVLNLPQNSKILVSPDNEVVPDDELAKTKGKVFKSPIKGKVVGAEKGKVKLEFRAEKIEGKGWGKGHQWGKLVFLPQITFIDLDQSHQDKIVFIKEIDSILIAKAKALGIKGIVCYSLIEGGESLLSILVIGTDDKQVSVIQKAEGKNCLLDLNNNCLLIAQ